MDGQHRTAPTEFRTGGAITMGILSILVPVVGVVLGIIAIVKGTKGLGQAPASHPARSRFVAAIVLGAVGLLAQFTIWLTVVLAGVVFVLVQDLGDEDQVAIPSIAFTKDESADRFTVVRVEPGVDWSEIHVRTEGGPVYLQINGESSTSATRVDTTLTPLPAGAIAGSDYLDFCAEGGADEVQITLIHGPSNAQIYSSAFRNIQAC